MPIPVFSKSVGGALLLSSLLTMGLFSTPATGGGRDDGSLVLTGNGPVRGFVENGVHEFLGIPYAAPPVGPLRWMPPQPPASWEKPLDATAFANTCPQNFELGVYAGPPSTTEDCLYLNVFTTNVGRDRDRSERDDRGGRGKDPLFCRGAPPHASYLFKHALVQDAAYGTLLRARRQECHARVATMLEEHFADPVERQPELLAHHLTAAGDTERAVDQWLKAGQYAAERSAHFEAIGHFDRGLSALAALPEGPARDRREIELQLAKGVSLIIARGFSSSEAAEAQARARDLCEKTGDADHLFVAIWGLWNFRRTSDLDAARDLSDRLLTLVEKNDDTGLRLEAHHTGWTTHFFRGEPAPAQDHCEKGRGLYDFERHRSHAQIYGHDPGVCARTVGAWSEWLLGRPDKALARINDALALAEQLTHAFSLAMARVHASILHQFRRDPEMVLQYIGSAEALAAEKRLALPLDPRIARGWALLVPDGIAAAVAPFRAALADRQKHGTTQYGSYSLTLFAEVLAHSGDHDGALAALADADAIAEKCGERWWKAEIYRLRGALTLSRGGVGESEAWFAEAIDTARRQQAKSLELRAATSLARLWGEQGRRAAARDLLAPLYDWFTEGFDTADLKEAKTLLGALA